MEAVNVRAEGRVSRDLLQDIADVQSGYTVTHEADVLAAAKAQKAERRQKALQARIRKAKMLILQCGLSGIGPTEKYRVQKMIDKGLITQEDLSYLDQQRTELQSIEQLSFY